MATEKRLIDANALYAKAEEKYKNSSGFYRPIYRGFVDDVADAPTVDTVEVVHGRWIPSTSTVKSFKCSVCKEWTTKHSPYAPDFNYCPNCGAKMDGERRDGA